jgi:hypothetical protein
MTERNDDGTYAPSEPLLGQAGIERDFGFTPMPEPFKPDIEPISIEGAVARQQAAREVEVPQEVIEVGYQNPETGEKVPVTETVTLERATDDLKTYHTALNDTAETHVSSEFTKEIDRLRGESLQANPEIEKELGLSKAEVAAAEAALQPSEMNDAARARMAEPTEPDPYDSIEGLDAETKEALKKPQIRSFLEKNATETDQAVTAYQTALAQAQTFGQGSLLAIAPQLSQIPRENWAQAIQIIAQKDPARGQQIVQVLQNVAALNERQQLVDVYQQSQRRHQFEAQSKIEDSRFEQMIGDKAKISEAAKEILPYFEEIGISKDRAAEMFNSTPALRTAEAQRIIFDALQYRKMQGASKAVPTRNLPPVARPGTASANRGNTNTSEIRALERQLAGATSHAAIKIGAKLLAAKRAG